MNEERIVREISKFVKNYPEQTSAETHWKKPLVAFASVEDPLFLKLKEVVRPSHALPRIYFRPGRPWCLFPPFSAASTRECRLVSSCLTWVWLVETNRLIGDRNRLNEFRD
jgi:hypothetical protein